MEDLVIGIVGAHPAAVIGGFLGEHALAEPGAERATEVRS